MLNIVEINVTITNPGAPSKYLRTGTFISQGGTNLNPGEMAFLTNSADLTTHLNVSIPQTVELVAMNTTYWAQGNNNGVYVLELGLPSIPSNAATEGAAALTAFMLTNPDTFFLYLLPRSWGISPDVVAMVANYDSPDSMVYFLVTTTIAGYSAWFSGGVKSKAALLSVEAPSIPSTEFSLASALYVILNYNPGSASMVTPLCFSFLYGVTPYPMFGNKALLNQLKVDNVGYVTTAAEGGLTNTMLVWGLTGDGMQFNYWFSVAWTIINTNLAIANEVINGSNNGLAPLYYNDFGITRLQNRTAKTVRQGVAAGLILGSVSTVSLDPQIFAENIANGVYAGNAVVNAVPFKLYAEKNPQDYAIGLYAGLQMLITPQLGFTAIRINMLVSLFV
jgi:hypothetical protein